MCVLDIDTGITMNITFVTATIDAATHSSRMILVRITNRHLGIGRDSSQCSQATAKYILRDSAVVDIYCRIIDVAFFWSIGCLVTTAIDTMGNRTAIDIDGDRFLRCTQNIVTAKHVVDTTTSHRHSHRAIDVSSMICRRCFIVFTLTATIEVAGECAAIEIHLSGLSISVRLVRFIQMGVYLTLRTTAINIACDVCIAYIVVGG